MQCRKCQGLLGIGYDSWLREEYTYCINCGSRPEINTRRADGLPLTAPIQCRKCKQHPVMTIMRPLKGEIRSDMCQYCRIEHLAERRLKKQGYVGV